ncbi:hypothetical protein [Enterococcus sp.]|nr:hypothetical protein [Enterococcus sp.]
MNNRVRYFLDVESIGLTIIDKADVVERQTGDYLLVGSGNDGMADVQD